MNTLVTQTLKKTGLPVGRLRRPGTATEYIVFYPYNEYPGQFADNNEVQTKYSYQVDIFTKQDYEPIAKAVHSHMLAAGFIRITKFGEYEEETGYYRVVFRFSYAKEKGE